mmetsp:Transcript_51007/g.159391  ORF Transcript_51007/g.159391 Transcript_51007/m.159391 type:complete len:203 (+) Transcript_51007:192-800(+)
MVLLAYALLLPHLTTMSSFPQQNMFSWFKTAACRSSAPCTCLSHAILHLHWLDLSLCSAMSEIPHDVSRTCSSLPPSALRLSGSSPSIGGPAALTARFNTMFSTSSCSSSRPVWPPASVIAGSSLTPMSAVRSISAFFSSCGQCSPPSSCLWAAISILGEKSGEETEGSSSESSSPVPDVVLLSSSTWEMSSFSVASEPSRQ